MGEERGPATSYAMSHPPGGDCVATVSVRPVGDAETGACGKRGGVAAVQQLRRRCDEAEGRLQRSDRDGETGEAYLPLR